MYCTKCGNKLNEDAKFCSNCGHHIEQKNSSKTTWIILSICVCLIIIFAVGIRVYKTPPSPTNEILKEEQTTKPENIKVSSEQKVEEETNITDKEKTQVIKESLPKVFTVVTSQGYGSGFLYENGGYIVTNAHVVAGDTDVIIRNSSGQEAPAKVIGISDRSDIALLYSQQYEQVKPLPLELEKSIVGTEVIAIGSPQGFENSASIGYLTGTNRNMELGFVYEELYQVDAQIDQGSSGGPLVDAKTGKVIGINSLIYENHETFAFSIPLYTVAPIIDDWIHNPMNEQEIASLFDVYDSFIYTDSSTDDNEYYDEDYYEDYNFEDNSSTNDDYSYTFDEVSLTSFITSFRDYYELALAYEDFYWIQDMLLPGSVAYLELEEYIQDITGQGFTFDFTANNVIDIEIYNDYAIVSTNEQFDFYNASGEYLYYDRYKDYTVILTEDGYYQITDIYIYD